MTRLILRRLASMVAVLEGSTHSPSMKSLSRSIAAMVGALPCESEVEFGHIVVEADLPGKAHRLDLARRPT